MAYVAYILQSPSSGKFYIGQTEDLRSRFITHNPEEHGGWTKAYQPWELFWSLELPTRQSAMKVEKYLKKKPRSFLKRLPTDQSLNEYILNKIS